MPALSTISANGSDGIFEQRYVKITSPVRRVSYQLRTSHPEVTIPLQAKVAAQVRTLFWFDDNRYIGSTDPQVALTYRQTDVGIHNIRVVDDQGQVAERKCRWIGWNKFLQPITHFLKTIYQ